MLRGMWDLPGPGLEPVSPALAGGFLTIAPPGKSRKMKFLKVPSTDMTPKAQATKIKTDKLDTSRF